MACEALREHADSLFTHGPSHRAVIAEYERRRPLALEAARWALAGTWASAAGSSALAAPTGAAPSALALPQEVYAWRDAKLAEIAALDAYNARVLYARERDEVDGFGRTRVEAEFQAWTAASNTARAALKAMIAPLFAALAAPKGAAPKGDGHE